jgi:hypothetical protein
MSKNAEQTEAENLKQAQADALMCLCSALIRCKSVEVGTYRDGDMFHEAMGKLRGLGFQCVMVPADFVAYELTGPVKVGGGN